MISLKKKSSKDKKKKSHSHGLLSRKSSFRDDLRAFERDNPHLFNPNKVLLISFLRGFANGAGFLLAMAVAIPVTIFVLHQIQWVPIIGEMVADVIKFMREVETSRR